MSNTLRSLAISFMILIFVASCGGPEAIYDLSDDSYSLLNSDSSTVNFPGDYEGNISVISFIYTNCPDICPVITANMINIQKALKDSSGINFIEITFDPERDTPSVLRDYKNLYRLNDQFSLLTGDTATINTLLDDLEIVAQKTIIDSLGHDSTNYAMRHSNTLYLMDEHGRIRAEYPAHRVPPEHVIEDIQTLR